MDRDFSVGGHDFKLLKLDALKQFHIARRVAPVLKDLLPAIAKNEKLKKSGVVLSEEEEMAQVLVPVMNGISSLTEQEADRLLIGLLSAVEIKQAQGNWAKVATLENGIMFMDLPLPTLLNAAGRAFMYNMQGFITALPQVSPGKA